MNTEEFKAITASVKRQSEDHNGTAQTIKTASHATISTKKLSKAENKSWLIKAGVACLVFPDPTISDVVGVTLLAAGAVQEGIKRQAVYIEDLPKAFNSAMKELKNAREF